MPIPMRRTNAFFGLGIVLMLLTCTRGLSNAPANEPFQQTWERTDQPVASEQVDRTWMWGPEAFTDEMNEPYAEAPGGQRTVQYFDKSRMELNHPDADSSSAWFVTNGLLVVEMMTGRLQTGDNTFEERQPAQINVAGDADDPNGPTYATLATVADDAPFASDSVIAQTINRDGVVGQSQTGEQHAVTAGPLVPETNHRVASAFWDFMNSDGLIYQNGETVTAKLFLAPFYATGFPVTEAYWSTVQVDGVTQEVLIQAFERRVLTYTPDNPEGWRVESGNVGRHYHDWRYAESTLPEVIVTIDSGSVSLFVEVAETRAQQRCGLMHRFSMPENQGMLFVYTSDDDGGFWNRNTEIPLQLAWIAADGTILELTDMAAADRSSPDYPITYRPDQPYRYVIEANQGWFSNQGIEVGNTIDLSEALTCGASDEPTLCETQGY